MALEEHARPALQDGNHHLGFHKAPQLVRAVHAVEQSLGIARSDRAWRIACTVADQAIQGPGSVQFSARESHVDGLPEDALAVGVCKFHIIDGVGCRTDQRFGETQIYDRMLRLVRRSFAWGTGDIILCGVAKKLMPLLQSSSGKLQSATSLLPRVRQGASLLRQPIFDDVLA